MAAAPSSRRSGEIADLIDLFSKTQYRAKEVTSQVRGDPTWSKTTEGWRPQSLGTKCRECCGPTTRGQVSWTRSGASGSF